MATKEIQLTKEGKEKYEKELDYLRHTKKDEVIEKLTNARGMGDLSENADYDAARNEQAEVEARIKELQTLLENAKIVEVKKTDKSAGIGKTVTIENVANGKKMTFDIVSKQEADVLSNPNNMRISNECVVGVCLNGHKIGDVVTINVANPYDVKIIEVKPTNA